MDYNVFLIFAVLSNIPLSLGACPQHCKAGQKCTEPDSGCPVCERAYFGRKCQHRTECRYSTSAEGYRGTMNKTVGGHTCQEWNLTIHTPSYKDQGEKNYCKNIPNSGKKAPWCFTTNPGVYWEYCSIPMCNTQCPSPTFGFGSDVRISPPFGFSIGYVAFITCLPGFESSYTSYKITCKVDKKWDWPNTPSCFRKGLNMKPCLVSLIFQILEHRRMNGVIRPEGMIKDKSFFRHTPAGVGPSLGREVKCPRPSPKSNSQIINEQHVYRYEDKITFVCNTGYTLRGQNISTCKADKSWSSSPPSCTVTECPAPKIPHSSITNPKEIYVYRDTVTIKCNTGYRLKGAKQIQCHANETWGTSTTCEKIQCPLPSLKSNNKIINQKPKYEYQDRITIVCNTGYTLQGQNDSTCLANKSWSSSPPNCTIIECPAPESIPHSSMTNTKERYVYQDNVTIRCDTGYTLKGQKQIQCYANKTWSTSTTCEINRCHKPSIRNGTISKAKSTYQYRENITITCDHGYILNGDAELTCLVNQSWGLLPSCAIAECTSPVLSEKLRTASTNRTYHYGDVMPFSCVKGYKVKGKSIIRCGATAQWNDLLPVCEKIICDKSVSAQWLGIIAGVCITTSLISVFVTVQVMNRFQRRKDENSLCVVKENEESYDIAVNVKQDDDHIYDTLPDLDDAPFY